MNQPILRAWRVGAALLVRDWRSGELRLLGLSLVLAVAAMTSVGFFVDRLRAGLERDAGQLMGADMVLSADLPIDDAIGIEAQKDGLETAQTIGFQSMAIAGTQARLASIKAVSPGYPLRGHLRTAASPTAADSDATGLPDPGTVWVDASLLGQLQVGMGDAIKLGERSFRITRIVTIEPDRGFGLSSIAPRIMMRIDELPATQLLQAGSRESRRLLVAGNAQKLAQFHSWLMPRLQRGQRLETLEGGRPEVRATLDRAEQFLSLVALLTAMLAAVAVALAARRFTQRHLDGCAVMRCMGATQIQLLHVYLAEFTLIGIAGAVLGVVLGFCAHYVFIFMLGAYIKSSLPAPSLVPALQGFLVGFVLLAGFALPPVIQLRHVSPLRVLRRELGLPSGPAILGYALGILLFAGLLLWTAGNLRIGAWTAGGFALSFAIFAASAWVCLVLGARARHLARLSPALRFALASMSRRPVATVVQTVALSIGLMALLLLSVTREDLVSAWRKSTPPDAPNRFVINIQPEEHLAWGKTLNASGVGKFDLAPMIRGRLIDVNGKSIGPKNYTDDQAQRLVDREFNLSYGSVLPAHNRIASGKWFDGPGEVSMEEGIAHTLGLKLGDELVFDIAGQHAAGKITSLRKLEWDSMRVNFFVIFSPGSVDNMAQTWISAFHLTPAQANLGNTLVQTFPDITIIDTEAILRQIQDILDQVITAVEFLFVFTLGAGLLVLYAALLSSRDERTREAALLRALGASRRQLSSAQLTEYAAVGALSGLLAAGGAVVVGWVLADRVFNFPYTFDIVPWIAGLVGGILVALTGGWLGLRPVLNQPPLASLRDA